MTQLVQRRCLVTSAVMHAMLLGALALLSAFAPKAPELPTQPYILLVATPDRLSAEPTSGGTPSTPTPPPRETPRATETPRPVPPPPVTPPPVRRPPPAIATPRLPAPVTPPTSQKRVEVTDHVVPNPSAKAQDVDTARPAPRKGVEVSSNIVRTPVEDRKKREREQREKADALAREEAAAESERRETDRIHRLEWERKDRERRHALAGVVKGLSENLAPDTKIELPAGPGRGGEVVMEYGGYVQSVFQAAWNRNRPGTLAAKSAKSRVALTIRRDGSFTYKVLSPARINDVDAAIGRILAQQRRLNPLPRDLKGDDLEIIITFNLESSPSG